MAIQHRQSVAFGNKKDDLGIGWGLVNIQEPQVSRVDYEMTWMKPKIDLRELAKLHESGLSLREIANHLGAHKSTLHRYLSRLKQK